MNLDTALEAHADWKIKLRAAIRAQSSLDAASISKDSCCQLGQWLLGDASRQYPRSSALADCISQHRTFHCEAGKVAETINARQFEKAEAMLAAASSYSSASLAVGSAIIRLKRELARAA